MLKNSSEPPRPAASGASEPSVSAPDATIVAISSPAGKGGIGVVRLSGPQAIAVARRLFCPRRDEETGTDRVVFGRFVSPSGDPVDHGYLVTFPPGRAFTGEETAELWAHGSPAVLRFLVEAAVSAGARPATPGEFTLRAFLNGRIDLTQAEAIRDLIEARTLFQAKVAHDQVMGRVSSEVNRVKDDLADLVARVEASIEFAEEAEAERFNPEGGFAAVARGLRERIEGLAGSYERGRRVREGLRVAILGAPNVGKSSLFNRLLEEDRAIVTPVAGTTRDLIEETLDLEGIPVTLVDTAGLHDPDDEAGAEAVRRAEGALRSADLRIVVLDWGRPLRQEEMDLLRSLEQDSPLVVLNKVDLPCGVGMDRVLHLRRRHAALEVSAKTGDGVADLRKRLADAAGGGSAVPREETFLTNVRHRDLLTRAAAAMAQADGALRNGAGEEYAVLDLRAALDHLGEITGEVGLDGIYDRIFKNFCIGK
jgi:tRNA modification GTPase